MNVKSVKVYLIKYFRSVGFRQFFIGKVMFVVLLFCVWSVLPGVPDGAARLKTRSAGWNRAGLELNTLDG